MMNEFSFELIRDVAPQPIVLEPLHTEENGVFAPPAGVNGFSQVEVAVPIPPAPVLTSLSVNENGTYLPPEGTDGFDSVEVEVPEDTIIAEGKLDYAFSNSLIWTQIKDRVVFGAINHMEGAFMYNYALKEAPTLEIDLGSYGHLAMLHAFWGTYITEYPTLINLNGGDLQVDSFGVEGCQYLRTIDPAKVAHLKLVQPLATDGMFSNCRRLRRVPQSMIDQMDSIGSTNGGGFENCYSMDEITGYPKLYTRYNFLNNLYRLKRFTYAYSASDEADVSGKIFNFKNVVGYANVAASTFIQQTDFTVDTQITDATTYAALKNNPDAWTTLLEYSRFNRASAAEMITTLPTNIGANAATIQFIGNSGSATDEGAINTMTNEEVAVATAKNYTIAYQ